MLSFLLARRTGMCPRDRNGGDLLISLFWKSQVSVILVHVHIRGATRSSVVDHASIEILGFLFEKKALSSSR